MAYVVPNGTARPTTTSLRRYLAQKLPDFMIPSAFVALDAMPKGGSGKLDRGSLPAPGRARPELETQFVAPASPVEEKLCAIWSAVLNVDTVGARDDFLDLGGHSLLAGQVMSRVRDAFQVDLPLAALFAAGTVANLAVMIAQRMAENARPEDIETILREIEDAAGAETDKGLPL